MKQYSVLGVVIVAVALGACGSSSKSNASSSSTTASATTGPYSYGTTSPTTATAATSSVALKVTTIPKLHKSVLVDSSGKTVYLYVPDGSSTSSKVPAALKAIWPAATTTSTSPAVSSGLAQDKVRVNSVHQISYNGHLLYTFSGDAKAGTANGQGLGKIWYVVSPNGTPIM